MMKLLTYKNTRNVVFSQMVGTSMLTCEPGATCQAPASMASTLKKYGLVEVSEAEYSSKPKKGMEVSEAATTTVQEVTDDAPASSADSVSVDMSLEYSSKPKKGKNT